MYVREVRGSNPVLFSDSFDPLSDAVADQNVEETYSWRTGRRLRTSGNNTYTIPAPPPIPSGAIGAINARLQYINDISMNMASPPPPFQGEGKRFLTHDTGHNYVNIKYNNTGRFHRSGIDYNRETMRVTQGSVNAAVICPSGLSTLLWTSDRWDGFSGVCPPDNLQRNADSTSLFNSARPDASISGWGETIYELLSGNLPKVVTRLGHSIVSGKIFHTSLKDTSRELGSDYLNGQFGWVPFMRDFQSTLEQLLQIHNLLFATTYKRQRRTQLREFSSPSRTTPATGSNTSIKGQPATTGRMVSWPAGYENKGKYEYSYDTRLAARFTRARATSKANEFADTALDILQHFGVYYPSLAWDLIPYSFLVDWCFYLGKGIENYSTYSKTNGSFLTDYAYVTHRYTSTFRFPGITYATPGRYGQVVRISDTVATTVTTHRRQGTPFGFGVDLSGLSGPQYAILVALGLAKSR